MQSLLPAIFEFDDDDGFVYDLNDNAFAELNVFTTIPNFQKTDSIFGFSSWIGAFFV